ncbi:helix-turn-helix domain-containing protein [Paenibacillus sp. OSY-SE]|uniref:helix-turn-helix domain-containing protein n=1 Tax=Paenibacillus sp. OSY-SE TaxID=1196323 RepID=UPI00036CA325|nr:helix-turn-helix domain-containing protein [Paenibacillus sp. OSY-SE]
MRVKPKILHYAAYRNMLLSFILLTGVIVALICVTMFILFSRSSSKDVGEISESMLAQTSYAANILDEQVHEIGNHLINNQTIISSMFKNEVNYIEEYHTVNLLKDIETTYPFLGFIGIYNGYTNRYINTKGISASNESALLKELNDSAEKMYSTLFPRKIVNPADGQEKNMLTFVLRPGYTSYLPKKSAIVINVDADYLKQLIGGLKNKNSNYLITMDKNGVVLSHSKENHFLEPYSGQTYINKILHTNDSRGSFIDHIDGQKTQVSFVKSEQLNWYFVSVSPFQDLFFNMNHLKAFTLTIAFIIFGIGIFLSIWLTNQMYNPIQRLFNKIMGSSKDLETVTERINEFHIMDQSFSNISQKIVEMESAVEVARRSSLFRYLNGSQSDLTNRYHEPLQGPYFRIIVMSIDSMKPFKQKNSDHMQSLIRFAICNIAQEWMVSDNHSTETEVIIINDQEIGILIQMKTFEDSPDLVACLAEIQRYVKEYFKLSITISIGAIVDDAELIRDSYYNAREAVHQRFFQGQGNIFDYENGVFAPTDSEIDYPYNIEKKLIESIQMNHVVMITRLIGQFIDHLQRYNYHQALFFLNQLLMSLNNHFNLTAAYAFEQRESYMEMAFHLSSYETLEEIADDLTIICHSICEQVEAKSKKRNVEGINKVKEYIDKNFWKPDISVDSLADYVNLTPGYLGKLFKTHFNQSVNDYLKNVRLEKSKQLLLETSDSANVISEKVGIYNTTYFYTLFKKKYGLSPAQYRNEMLLQRQELES